MASWAIIRSEIPKLLGSSSKLVSGYQSVPRKAFGAASAWVFSYITAVEAARHVVPPFRDRLDRPDPELTVAAYFRARRDLERQDL